MDLEFHDSAEHHSHCCYFRLQERNARSRHVYEKNRADVVNVRILLGPLAECQGLVLSFITGSRMYMKICFD